MRRSFRTLPAVTAPIGGTPAMAEIVATASSPDTSIALAPGGGQAIRFVVH